MPLLWPCAEELADGTGGSCHGGGRRREGDCAVRGPWGSGGDVGAFDEVGSAGGANELERHGIVGWIVSDIAERRRQFRGGSLDGEG